MIVREPLPQFLLMPLFAQRRSENIFRAFEAGLVHVFEREVKILRTGLGVDRQASIAGFTDFLQSVVATEMHDVDWRTGHFCESDGARRGFGFRRGRASEGVVFGSSLALGQGLLDDYVNGSAVLRVHAYHGSSFGRSAHRLEDAGVVEHENARV